MIFGKLTHEIVARDNRKPFDMRSRDYKAIAWITSAKKSGYSGCFYGDFFYGANKTYTRNGKYRSKPIVGLAAPKIRLS